MRSQNAAKVSPSRAAGEPAADEAVDRGVELLGRHAPEERAADRRLGAEPAAQEDVVGLAALPVLVAQRRALEAEVADPVVGAGVRAAVEVEAQPGDVVAEALLQALTSRPSRVFVSVTEKLQCGSPVQAIERPRRRLTSSGKPISASARDVSSTRASGTFVTTKFCWRVTRTSPPTRSARSATAIIWSPETRPRWTGTPT